MNGLQEGIRFRRCIVSNIGADNPISIFDAKYITVISLPFFLKEPSFLSFYGVAHSCAPPGCGMQASKPW